MIAAFSVNAQVRVESPHPDLGTNPYAIKVQVNPDAEELFEKGRENCMKFRHSVGIPQLLQAVNLGSVNAQYHVGMMYLYGDNVDQDSKLAFQ